MTDQSPEGAYHYAVIRRALDAIDAADRPLSLEELAAEMQMSPAHSSASSASGSASRRNAISSTSRLATRGSCCATG